MDLRENGLKQALSFCSKFSLLKSLHKRLPFFLFLPMHCLLIYYCLNLIPSPKQNNYLRQCCWTGDDTLADNGNTTGNFFLWISACRNWVQFLKIIFRFNLSLSSSLLNNTVLLFLFWVCQRAKGAIPKYCHRRHLKSLIKRHASRRTLGLLSRHGSHAMKPVRAFGISFYLILWPPCPGTSIIPPPLSTHRLPPTHFPDMRLEDPRGKGTLATPKFPLLKSVLLFMHN